MEGFLLFAASVVVLGGLGALVEAIRCRRGAAGRKPTLLAPAATWLGRSDEAFHARPARCQP